ncbi:hypothetical protein Pelo_3639 [Pelomyxa schiedti]|nr:hypothetical protein Pelo_3639 [Pelomyxa schiedti]
MSRGHQDPHLAAILSLPLRLKKEILAASKVKLDEKMTEVEIVDNIRQQIVHIGTTYLCSNMPKEHMASVVVFDDSRRYSTKAAYARFLVGDVEHVGLTKYLAHVEDDKLELFTEALGMNETEDKSPDAVRQLIAEEIIARGIENFMRTCDHVLLRKCAKAMDIPITKHHTKQQILDAMATGELVEPEKKPKLHISKSKPPINEDITPQDLFQHYTTEELRKWCRTHKVKSYGKKANVISRIIAFYKGDKSCTEKKKKVSRKKKAKKVDEDDDEEKEKDAPEELEPLEPMESSTTSVTSTTSSKPEAPKPSSKPDAPKADAPEPKSKDKHPAEEVPAPKPTTAAKEKPATEKAKPKSTGEEEEIEEEPPKSKSKKKHHKAHSSEEESGEKPAHTHKKKDKSDKSSKKDKSDKKDKPDKSDKSDKKDKPDKSDKSDKPSKKDKTKSTKTTDKEAGKKRSKDKSKAKSSEEESSDGGKAKSPSRKRGKADGKSKKT